MPTFDKTQVRFQGPFYEPWDSSGILSSPAGYIPRFASISRSTQVVDADVQSCIISVDDGSFYLAEAGDFLKFPHVSSRHRSPSMSQGEDSYVGDCEIFEQLDEIRQRIAFVTPSRSSQPHRARKSSSKFSRDYGDTESDTESQLDSLRKQ